jgi:hypothetical protein
MTASPQVQPLGESWHGLEAWLRTADAGWMLDDLVLGCCPASEVEELLADYGIPWTRASRRRFAQLVDSATGEGF